MATKEKTIHVKSKKLSTLYGESSLGIYRLITVNQATSFVRLRTHFSFLIKDIATIAFRISVDCPMAYIIRIFISVRYDNATTKGILMTHIKHESNISVDLVSPPDLRIKKHSVLNIYNMKKTAMIFKKLEARCLDSIETLYR